MMNLEHVMESFASYYPCEGSMNIWGDKYEKKRIQFAQHKDRK